MAGIQFSVYLKPRLVHKLEDIARENLMSRNGLVAKIVEDYIDEYQGRRHLDSVPS